MTRQALATARPRRPRIPEDIRLQPHVGWRVESPGWNHHLAPAACEEPIAFRVHDPAELPVLRLLDFRVYLAALGAKCGRQRVPVLDPAEGDSTPFLDVQPGCVRYHMTILPAARVGAVRHRVPHTRTTVYTMAFQTSIDTPATSSIARGIPRG